MKGFLLLIVWFILWMWFIRGCEGAEVKLHWSANPISENVSEYRIYRDALLIAVSTGTSITVNLNPGDTVYLVAFNGQESEPSDPVTIPLPVKVTLWRSTNLMDKTHVAEFYFDRKEREFFSLTIETP